MRNNLLNTYAAVLAACPLFEGIEAGELSSMLGCLGAEKRHYNKGAFIFMEGDPPIRVGLVLSGKAQIQRESILGHRSILAEVEPADLFAEAFACARAAAMPVSVIALTDCEILLLDYERVVSTCPSACTFHSRLVSNMLAVMAHKNLALNSHLDHLSKRSIRDKVLSYLSEQAKIADSPQFSIPFDRQQLADYLCVDRSALSAELSRMSAEGLLVTHKRDFTLFHEDY